MNRRELEARLLYSVIVAGKSADFANAAMRRLMDEAKGDLLLDFILIRLRADPASIDELLRRCRVGNYTKIGRCFRELSTSCIDLTACLPEDLEKIHGIGPKTARFFILWTRPDARYAALDVHILRWMRTQGYDAPRSTPSGKKYAELERVFLAEADKRGMTPRELDEQIWDAGRRGSENIVEAAA